MISLHFVEKDPKKYEAKTLTSRREKRVIELMGKYLKKIKKTILNPYLEGKALNRRTGTLKSSIYIRKAKKVGVGHYRGAIGIGDRINPVNRVPAYKYGSAWEGWAPLPRRYKSQMGPRPFIGPSFEEYFEEFQKELAKIKVM